MNVLATRRKVSALTKTADEWEIDSLLWLYECVPETRGVG
jgi:hypothetical protein